MSRHDACTRPRRAPGRLAVALAALAPVLAASPAALAQAQGPARARTAQADKAEQADCSIFEIEASNGKPGVDPALRPLERKLKKPPFSSWKTFKLLKKHDKKLQMMKQLSLPLVTGSKLGLLYRDKSDDKGKKVRLRLGFTLDDKDGKRKVDGTIKLDSGDYYLIGGDELKGGGTYIVAVTCTAPR
ncbi:MAG TPA: hypothetical protein VKZ63_16900 [Kofleriaceae bacterium]|nr:hypothetical protein [Kofleriaceae bacterium]